MRNQKSMRGLALVAIAFFFGGQAATYEVGTLVQAGPGLFPLIVSSVVGLIGLVMIVQSRYEEDSKGVHFPIKNVLIVLAGLVGFVLISKYVTMLPAIPFLVFVVTLAGSDYSVVRNLKITAVLIAIAFALYYFLGLQLPLV